MFWVKCDCPAVKVWPPSTSPQPTAPPPRLPCPHPRAVPQMKAKHLWLLLIYVLPTNSPFTRLHRLKCAGPAHQQPLHAPPPPQVRWPCRTPQRRAGAREAGGEARRSPPHPRLSARHATCVRRRGSVTVFALVLLASVREPPFSSAPPPPSQHPHSGTLR